MSTRGWVTVNVFWLVTKGHEDIKLVSPESVQGLQLCPHASSLQKRISVDKVPQPVHVSKLPFYVLGVAFKVRSFL